MPRALPVLASELYARVWVPSPPLLTGAAVAQAWADAYGVYCLGALGCGTPPGPGQIDAAIARFVPLMTSAMSGTVAPSTAVAIAAAFTAWWTGFAFTGAPVAIPGAPTLGPNLLAQWVSQPLLGDALVAAQAHAAVIHAWTGTVVTGLPCNAPIG